jgi:hypothetical protein
VALHGEVAPGQGRAPCELLHDARHEAPSGEERRLHGDHPDLVGRAGLGVDEHRCTVRPRTFAGTGVRDLERAPRDRRRQQPKPFCALVAL